MGKSYDAIIIGAGIIGAAVGLELSKQGRKTLNIDRLPAAGYGSTSNSCATSTAPRHNSSTPCRRWRRRPRMPSCNRPSKSIWR